MDSQPTNEVKIPPMGCKPRRFWEQDYPNPTDAQVKQRAADLVAAIARYTETGYAYAEKGANFDPRVSVNTWLIELVQRVNSVPQTEEW